MDSRIGFFHSSILPIVAKPFPKQSRMQMNSEKRNSPSQVREVYREPWCGLMGPLQSDGDVFSQLLRLKGNVVTLDYVNFFYSPSAVSGVVQSPIFSKQPGSIVYPVETGEKSREVVFSCEAQGSPPPVYR
ncbi:hypothetical protein EYF80_011207 [Liparis tanakae]|uniref:Uncharacterized protein n=1 Tax=Liparis tanakae TaxID=230148 RepID=A0A4Z2IN14_9TELE|nr:hypothetical protein EYF80_011207 [Liparis tanakae]